jgi:Tfp pilus assembly protein PilN
MKLRLNLSTAPRENRRPFFAVATLLGTIGLIALALLSQVAYHAWQANRSERSTMADLERQIRESSARQAQLALHFRTPEAQRVLDRASFLNSLISERSFPWTKIFAALEETLPDGVRVVNIAPKLVKGRAEVDLTVGADNDEQKIRFLRAMEKSKSFSDVEVTLERRMDASNASNASNAQDRILLKLKVAFETI